MRIVHLAAEFAPAAHAGGLGQVLVGLSRELTRLGHEIEVILPKYDCIDLQKLFCLKQELVDFKCFEKGSLHSNTLWSATSEGCRLLLLETDHPHHYFQRQTIYGCADDISRFLYFSRACLEYLKIKNEPIDILHLHDWHTATAALLAKDLFDLPIKAIVLTIHNAQYQGLCAGSDLDAIGIDGSTYLKVDRLQDDNPQYPQTINLLKGGIVYADAVNTVSPSYAKEILTPEIGLHLHHTLCKYKNKLTGILNGIDQEIWNPEKELYTKDNSLSTLVKAKEAIQTFFTPTQRPYIGAITRLVPQKGPELLEAGLVKTLELGGSFLLIGSSPIPEIQTHFLALKEKYKDNKQVLFHFEYDDALAHKLFAALDILLVPSHFEPCGLTQLIAMRYGTIPVVRSTGGLKDTVFDCENSAIPIKKRNGFVFQNATTEDMSEALTRAVDLFRNEPFTWQSMMQRDMQLDFGWGKPAREYIRFYTRTLSLSALRM